MGSTLGRPLPVDSARGFPFESAGRSGDPSACSVGLRPPVVEHVVQGLLQGDLGLPSGGGGQPAGSPRSTGTSTGRTSAGSVSKASEVPARASSPSAISWMETSRPEQTLYTAPGLARLDQQPVGPDHVSHIGEVPSGRQVADRDGSCAPFRSASTIRLGQRRHGELGLWPGPMWLKGRTVMTVWPWPEEGLGRQGLGRQLARRIGGERRGGRRPRSSGSRDGSVTAP